MVEQQTVNLHTGVQLSHNPLCSKHSPCYRLMLKVWSGRMYYDASVVKEVPQDTTG